VDLDVDSSSQFMLLGAKLDSARGTLPREHDNEGRYFDPKGLGDSPSGGTSLIVIPPKPIRSRRWCAGFS
jgi:hypothetical protein